MNKMAFKLSLSKMIVSKCALLNWRQASLMAKSSANNALVQKYSLAWARRTEPLLFLTRKAELEVVVVNLQSGLHFNQSIWGFFQLWEVLEVDLSFFASWAFQWLRADMAIHFAAIWMGGMNGLSMGDLVPVLPDNIKQNHHKHNGLISIKISRQQATLAVHNES